MDTLTHGFVPYAAFTLARRPRVERIAAAVGGMAPDVDAIWAWVSHSHEQAYPLVHRGFSHTFWGAPLLATILLFLLSHRAIASRFPRFENLWFTRGALVPLWIGAWSHLLLDGVTITGIPLLWPFVDGRFTTDWFFFGVTYLVPLSLFAWIMVWRGKASDRLVKRVFAIMCVVLVLAGAVRAYSYPRDLLGDEDVTPGPTDWTWYVSRTVDGNATVYSTTWGRPNTVETFPEFVRADSRDGFEDARRRCENEPGYIPWKWYLWGEPVVHATQFRYVDEAPDPTVGRFPRDGPFDIQEGTWMVEFYDSAHMYEERHPQFRLWRNPARDMVSDEISYCMVYPDGRVEFHRDRGWIGS